ncbi:MAG: SCP2 sterol-binding domain-containing protein [Promethearchaeota archaeon]
MKNLERLKEIRQKGVETANIEDIPIVFQVICEFINTNSEAQKLLEDYRLSMQVKIKDTKPYYIVIENKNANFNEGTLKNPDFVIISDLNTISKLLLGHLDPLEAYFSEILSINGDLFKVVLFMEVLELAFKILEIGEDTEDTNLVNTSSMKRLIEVYLHGSPVEASQVPLFLEILTIFVNSNPEARDIISGEDLTIQIKITDLENYLIRINENRMQWSKETVPNPNLILEMSLETSVEVLLNGDPVSAYMAGKIIIEGYIVKALVLQSLIDLFLEFINL